MKRFFEYIEEAAKKPATKTEHDFKTGDTAGKLFELMKGYYQSRKQFPTHYRAEGKTPKDIHDIMARKMFGDDYRNHPEYKNLDRTARIAAEHNTKFNELEHGHDPSQGYQKVAWTSQPADHKSETGVIDKNSVADSIATLHHGQKVAHSDKITGVGKPVNYKNPGVKTFADMSGSDMSDVGNEHAATLRKHGINSGEAGYQKWSQWKGKRKDEKSKKKGLYHEPTAAELKKAEEIEASAGSVNQEVARRMHGGFAQIAADDRQNGTTNLRDAIEKAVAGPTHLRTSVTHTEVNPDGSHHRTKVYDLHDHVNQYLNHFDNYHVEPEHKDGLSSVAIYGHYKHPTDANHPSNGKRMRVANISVYSGGRPNNIMPRGAITLPSEHHKDIEYQNQVSSDPAHHTYDTPRAQQEVQLPPKAVRALQAAVKKTAPAQEVEPAPVAADPGGFGKFRGEGPKEFPAAKNYDPHQHKQFRVDEVGGRSWRGPGE
jgi:hypothetical protein